ncbi:MAG: nicotinate-nucleotide adenylyltransferase [Kiritimatiellales bacterium]|nr:nicotinate-nucleotide adenylyltransferase [Kiritimatiellales bacterium]
MANRIGIMGGSFDPIHFGHLIVAQDAIERLELSRVIFIPAATPPHKQHIQQVAAEHRLNMLKLAVETDLRFSVSDIELKRGGVSYTVDTVHEVRRQFADAELFLIIGSDTLTELDTWRNVSEIMDLCEIATFIRPGDDVQCEMDKHVRLGETCKEKLMKNLIEAHRVEISSTEIRMRLAEGLSIRYLVPPEAEMYIFEHGLYIG